MIKTVDVITISALEDVVLSDGHYSGGIEDKGNFREGFCWIAKSSSGNLSASHNGYSIDTLNAI